MKQRSPPIPQAERPIATDSRQPGATAQSDAAKLNAAFALHQQGRLDQAEAIYREILQSQPRHFDALQLLAAIAAQRRNYATAVELFDEALKINPDDFASLNNRGMALHDLRRNEEALDSYDRALEIEPNSVAVLNNRGNALRDLERFDEALESYDRALKIKPDHASALSNRGATLRNLKRFDEALESCDRALKSRPDYAGALYNRGLALHELKRCEEALESYDRALKIMPDHAEAHYNRGNALRDLERLDEALQCYDRALKIKPDYAEALNDRGNALGKLKRLEEALESYDRALRIKPDYAEAHNNRGNALCDLTRSEEALESYQRALKIKPDHAGALYNQGLALQSLNRLDEAVASYDRVIEIEPEHVEALSNRGNALAGLQRHEEALESYDRALTIRPNNAESLNNRANVLVDLKRYDEALQSYERALTIRPDYEFLYGTWLHTRMRICDWANLENNVAALVDKVSRGEKASTSFPVLSMSGSPALQRKAVEIWVQAKHPLSHALPQLPVRTRHGRIRVGYFSADFRTHAVSLLTAELFETHDRSRFEVAAFSFGPDTQDEVRKRLETAFEHFIDVRNKPDKEVAMLARSLEIDIAVDLGGYTEGSRPGIFAMRAAPLQVSYIGYLGTMGAPYIDYLIADPTIIPDDCRQHYSERIVYLPSYQANDSRRRIADKAFTREELGLPKTGFVFCCFNNTYKITPATFDTWMRILRAVPGSVLFLYAENELAAVNLKKEAALRGVDADRLVFGHRLPVSEYLARYRAADLFLDTLPYNAGTTASDALWAGLPVLTCMGEAFASRVAASLLTAIDLPELITSTQAEYETQAIELATHPERLKQIRHQLERNRLTTPLFDTPRFTRHLEAAYTQMYERYQAGLAPEHIHVPS